MKSQIVAIVAGCLLLAWGCRPSRDLGTCGGLTQAAQLWPDGTTLFCYAASDHPGKTDSAFIRVQITPGDTIDGKPYRKIRTELLDPLPTIKKFPGLYTLAVPDEGYVRSDSGRTYFLHGHYSVFRSDSATPFIQKCCSQEVLWFDFGLNKDSVWLFWGPSPFPMGQLGIEKIERSKRGASFHYVIGSNNNGLPHNAYVRYMVVSTLHGVVQMQVYDPFKGNYYEFKRVF